ncbi:hexaprenyldihydroxybenzoate methyltransferase [Coprinopsis sp. MPI-PUGE-AT-0042]|nr:hexaprenyldihydroxybenzoate methyltransferase [Coprinopsis sp. MPI-PUGE-AT-0042]
MNDYTARNREHFDQQSEDYQASRSALELAKRAAHAIVRHAELDVDTIELMDFACGAGLLSQRLAPRVKSILGVDISQGMVDLYNTFVEDQGIDPTEMQALCADLLSPDDERSKLNGRKFDIIVCSMAYHHFESITHATTTLSLYLKPQGFLFVIDLLKADGIDMDELFPEHKDHLVAHRGGFTEGEIEKAFEAAGMVFEFLPSISVKKKGHPLSLFVAKGYKQTEL